MNCLTEIRCEETGPFQDGKKPRAKFGDSYYHHFYLVLERSTFLINSEIPHQQLHEKEKLAMAQIRTVNVSTANVGILFHLTLESN